MITEQYNKKLREIQLKILGTGLIPLHLVDVDVLIDLARQTLNLNKDLEFHEQGFVCHVGKHNMVCFDVVVCLNELTDRYNFKKKLYKELFEFGINDRKDGISYHLITSNDYEDNSFYKEHYENFLGTIVLNSESRIHNVYPSILKDEILEIMSRRFLYHY